MNMNMSMNIDASNFLNLTQQIQTNLERELRDTMQDIVDDLARISSNIAPIRKSTLRRSVKKKVTGSVKLRTLKGTVSFRAVEDNFNYALWTHESTYKLGPISRASQGTDGYHVGNKYLSRPLYGEKAKYLRWMKEAVERSIG